MTTSLLIDFDNIIVFHNLSILKQRIYPLPSKYSGVNIGIILFIHDLQYNILRSLPKGRERVQYINTTLFVNSISDFVYILYHKHKKMVNINNNIHMEQVLSTLMSNLPNDISVYINIDMNDDISQYIVMGFDNAYISNHTPFGDTFSTDRIIMSKRNDVTKINPEVLNSINYMLAQYHSPIKNCEMNIKLSEQTIKYLHGISQRGSTLNSNGTITQKEIAGKLVVGEVTSDHIHYLDIDTGSLVHGKEEGVEIIEGLYNFHSHPREAYDRHKVQLGWPSAQDFIGFLGSAIVHNTILHIVIGIEGFYVLSLTEYWARNKDKLSGGVISFIKKNYDMCSRKNSYTPIDYIAVVNSIKYQENLPLFVVQFFSWEQASDSFTVSFQKNGINCKTK